MDYLILKTIHIISSVIMVGTGFGSALYMFCANRWGNLEQKRFVSRMVVMVDWVFTTPSIIIQPLTGYLMMRQAGFSFNDPWLQNVLWLYVLVGCAWIPVVWIQIKMSALTRIAVQTQTTLNPVYNVYRRTWESLGYIGFSGTMAIFYIMTTKQALW